jgi:hypothetical protein
VKPAPAGRTAKHGFVRPDTWGPWIRYNTKVWPLDTLGRRRGEPVSVQDLGVKLGRRAFRRLTWRVGTGGKLWSRFTFRRVKGAHHQRALAHRTGLRGTQGRARP